VRRRNVETWLRQGEKVKMETWLKQGEKEEDGNLAETR
jgi:hypothetical protein